MGDSYTRMETSAQHKTMTVHARLRDFQIFSEQPELQASYHDALFATYEPVRLWLRERKPTAPFKKILVCLDDERTAKPFHGHVMNALGVCRIFEAVNASTLAKHVEDHRWLLGVVVDALGHVAKATGWRSPEFESFIADLRERSWPLVHVFERFAQVDRRTGATCVPWLSTRPGETKVGVRIGTRDVAVLSGPIWLEDDFPLAKVVIKGRDYVVRDRGGKTLASVSIDRPERADVVGGPTKGVIAADPMAALHDREAEFRRGEAPVVAELKAAGLRIESMRDLVDIPGSFVTAVPILLAHLPRPYPQAVRVVIALALGDPETNASWPTLVRLYRAERDDRVRDALAVALVIAATDDQLDDVMTLAREPQLGASRLRLLSRLEGTADPRARRALMDLRTDPDLGAEIEAILKREAKREADRAQRAAGRQVAEATKPAKATKATKSAMTAKPAKPKSTKR